VFISNRAFAALSLAELLFSCVSCAAERKPPDTTPSEAWPIVFQLPRPEHNGKPQASITGYLWLPPNEKAIRGLLVGSKTMLEGTIEKAPEIRAALIEKKMGALFLDPSPGLMYSNAPTDPPYDLERCLTLAAEKSGHPELAFTPMLTVGHSTGGIFCRNVAYWQPDRVIGVLHVMSGNFQDKIADTSRSLAGVPLLAINGEFEKYGPAGGDLGAGLRSEYSLNADKKKENQTQWLMVRMQILDRRRKNPNNLMGLVVHRGKGHTDWSDAMSALAAQFIRSSADARLPKEIATGNAIVKCNPLRAEDGWLVDADIKDPKHKPALFKEYEGDKALAFWYPDKAIADAVAEYHKGPWAVPDPTAGKTAEQRFVPPPVLQDSVDAPKAPR
jgi:hypothetical protein